MSNMQDKRALKIGMDFGLNVGKKLNQNATVDNTILKKDEDAQTKAFTISK